MASTRLHWGGYDFGCLACCARLVLSASPDRKLARAQMAAISRFKGSPKLADVLQCVRQMTAKPD